METYEDIMLAAYEDELEKIASAADGAIIGGALGALAGAVTGATAGGKGHRLRGAGIGAASGGLLGAGVGAVAPKLMTRAEEVLEKAYVKPSALKAAKSRIAQYEKEVLPDLERFNKRMAEGDLEFMKKKLRKGSVPYLPFLRDLRGSPLSDVGGKYEDIAANSVLGAALASMAGAGALGGSIAAHVDKKRRLKNAS